MERIVLATTPRTGSNLLLYALEQHPDAISGGEWFNNMPERNWPHVWENKQTRPSEVNLIKLFAYESHLPTFEQALSNGVVVYLYRVNRAGQLASWKKACETGIWTKHQTVNQFIIPFNPNSYRHINNSFDLFWNRATLRIAYEDMIANWDATIAKILEAAKWSPAILPMTLEKQT